MLDACERQKKKSLFTVLVQNTEFVQKTNKQTNKQEEQKKKRKKKKKTIEERREKSYIKVQ